MRARGGRFLGRVGELPRSMFSLPLPFARVVSEWIALGASNVKEYILLILAMTRWSPPSSSSGSWSTQISLPLQIVVIVGISAA